LIFKNEPNIFIITLGGILMTIYNPYLKPYDVSLKLNNKNHITDGLKQNNADQVVPTFAEALNRAFNNINQLEHESQRLQVAMVTNPESVDAHQVAIAQTKAELSLSFAKAISSRLINGFKELENLR